MPNILLVSTNKKLTNGASQCVLIIAKGLKERGINVVVATPKGPLSDKLKDMGITVEYMYQFITLWKRPTEIQYNAQWKRTISKLYYGNIYKKINYKIAKKYAVNHVNKRMKEIIEKHNIDLVHINAITSGFPAIIPEKMGIPVVWHIREFLEEDLKSRFVSKKFSYNLINKADKMIAISKSVKGKYEKLIKTDIELVYDGVETEKFYNKHDIFTEDRPKIVISGRITKNKGQDHFVKAISILKKQGVDVIGNIYGAVDNAKYIRMIEDTIQSSGIRENVEIKGFTNDIKSRLLEHDIMCVCSKSEGFGLTTVEGMLEGLLVIGAKSDFSATGELIEDGVTGLLYDYSHGAEGLAEKIKWAVEHKEEAKHIALNGQKMALDKFCTERNIDGIVGVYNEVLHRRTKSCRR